VRIELRIPGLESVIVSHEPDENPQGYRSPDLQEAIDSAFTLAEQSLRDLKIIHATNLDIAERGDLGFLGEICEVYPLEGHGFLIRHDGSRLIRHDGSRLFFHRDAIITGDFDYLVSGAQAFYVEDNTSDGPIAVKVWVRQTDR